MYYMYRQIHRIADNRRTSILCAPYTYTYTCTWSCTVYVPHIRCTVQFTINVCIHIVYWTLDALEQQIVQPTPEHTRTMLCTELCARARIAIFVHFRWLNSNENCIIRHVYYTTCVFTQLAIIYFSLAPSSHLSPSLSRTRQRRMRSTSHFFQYFFLSHAIYIYLLCSSECLRKIRHYYIFPR